MTAPQRPEGWAEMTPAERTTWHRDNRTNRTGFLGVKREGKRYVARIRPAPDCERRLRSKSVPTAEEAARLYDAMAREIYGDDAVLNFPEDAR